jgi:hypothetical protein
VTFSKSHFTVLEENSNSEHETDSNTILVFLSRLARTKKHKHSISAVNLTTLSYYTTSANPLLSMALSRYRKSVKSEPEEEAATGRRRHML